MRFIRPLSAGAAALAVAAGLTGPAIAQTAPAGIGTSVSSTKVLTAQLGENGSLLDLALLTDDAQATLDSAVAAPGSFSRLSLGKVSSSIVALDAVNKQLPTFEAKSTGPTSTDITAGALGLAEPVLKGTVSGGKLTATLENGVAASGLTAEVTNVTDAVGGLLTVASAKAVLDAKSAPDAATASRSASVTDVTVLDLGALLQGLGIDLGSLTVAQVAALLDALAAQAGVDLPVGTTTVTGAIDTLQGTIATLQTTVANTTTSALPAVDATVNSTLSGLLGSAAPTLPTTGLTDPAEVAATLTVLNDTITALTAELDALLDSIVTDGVKALDGLALLRLEGVEVGVATKAVQDVNASTATATGKIGKVVVGNLTLASGLDLLAAADQVNAAIASVNTKIGEVLGAVDPGLASLVKVAVLEKATEVTTKNGYTTASAGITALSATITPPAALAAIVDTVNALTASTTDEVADLLGVGLSQVPAELGLSTSMNSLASTLSLGFGALSQPATLRVAQVLSASNYRVGTATPAAPGTSPTLPRTGNDTLLITIATAVVLGLITRRFLLAPQPKRVRVEK